MLKLLLIITALMMATTLNTAFGSGWSEYSVTHPDQMTACEPTAPPSDGQDTDDTKPQIEDEQVIS